MTLALTELGETLAVLSDLGARAVPPAASIHTGRQHTPERAGAPPGIIRGAGHNRGVGIFSRKRKPAPPPPAPDVALDSEVGREIAAMIDRHARDCVAVGVGPVTADSTTSYFGGFPYLPSDADWPLIDGEPAVFTGQVNFAEVPPLAGFPRSGLLQWFTGSDDTLGLTFDETQGAVGFVVRSYADAGRASQQPVSAEPPMASEYYSNLDTDAGATMTFAAGRCLPDWDELDEASQADPFWVRLAEAVGQDPEQLPDGLYSDYVQGGLEQVVPLVLGSKIGGYPTFIQADPRGDDSYPAAAEPGGQLIIELNGGEVGGWGDVGRGRLFGDPSALAIGDTSSVRYHWDT